MSSSREPPEGAPIAFCPYCREGFEGLEDCPEHDLTLVPLDRLPRRHRPSAATFFLDPRLGRAPVLLGAALVILGFAAPVLTVGEVRATGIEVALDGAANLWLVPGAALAVLAVLWARRAGSRLRRARLAVFGLALSGSLPLLYTCRRVVWMAEARGAVVDWQWGLGVIVVGLLLTALGSARLGRRAEQR